jgi:hypothetical protein
LFFPHTPQNIIHSEPHPPPPPGRCLRLPLVCCLFSATHGTPNSLRLSLRLPSSVASASCLLLIICFFLSPHLKTSFTQSHILLLFLAGALASLLYAIYAAHRAPDSLRLRLRLPFSRASASCLLLAPPTLIVLLHQVLSAGVLVSTSFCSSPSCCAPLIQLVAVPPPVALASAIHHASTFLLLRVPLALVRLIVTLPGALPTPLGAALPGALASASRCTPLIWLVCCIGRCLGLSY